MKRTSHVLCLLAACVLATTALGQEAIGPFISTVGTTVREPATGRDWAYVLWTANTPSLVNGRSHAIYAKAGDANSPSLFTRAAIVSLQTEAVTLTPLLARAAMLGDDTNTLHVDIDALFGKFIPANLPLPQKLSAVVRGAIIDERNYGRLVLLARTHPCVAMSMGFAHAELIGPGQTTFEIREFDRGTQTDGAVIGRVTVTAGSPTLLPAPGPVVEMPQPYARGHLNTQLRWSVPDPLRRLSLLQHGYNVWRVREDYAEARGWNTTPPAPSALVSNALQTTAVRRLNRLPLMISKTFDAAQAANVTPPNGDTNTIFVIDDNDRGRSNVITTLDFTNGARFYYFVTARDILGRDGFLSPGTEIQICDKLPPDALRDVEVANDFSWQGTTNRFRLRVDWTQALNLPLDEERIRAYWVYRWTNIAELRARQANSTNNRIAVVNHINGRTTNSYLDGGPSAPTFPADASKTFWYTVRAEDSGVCGGNLSPHSAPVFGVLRDRAGPTAPTGTVSGICYEPDMNLLGRVTNGNPNAVESDLSFQISALALRGNRLIEWVEFHVEVRPFLSTNISASYSSGRRYFSAGAIGSSINFPFDVPAQFAGQIVYFTATAGFADGSSSTFMPTQTLSPGLEKGDQRVVLLFGATVQEPTRSFPCDRHFTVGPSDTLQPIELNIQPMAGSKELRVYRRVDDGPLELIYQRKLDNLNLVPVFDDTFPHGGGKVCYFATTLDEHGNASALTRLGCKYAIENAAPPRPQLSPITPLGPQASPQMLLSWFCPSVNIERFEVGIAALGSEIISNCAPEFLDALPQPSFPELQNVHPDLTAHQGLDLNSLDFRRFITPQPNATFGQGDRFVVPVDIDLGRSYFVYVKSIAHSGARSESSTIEGFIWRATNAPQPLVPWPARPMPPIGNSFTKPFTPIWQLPCGETNGPSNIVVHLFT
ncbi:MAG TPA: hypothetical protein VK530_21535, partial [Candidatus Acidoferrum sp.]|nr:hypothetical protein [Candidatus Acidoferrum sp.]